MTVKEFDTNLRAQYQLIEAQESMSFVLLCENIFSPSLASEHTTHPVRENLIECFDWYPHTSHSLSLTSKNTINSNHKCYLERSYYAWKTLLWKTL